MKIAVFGGTFNPPHVGHVHAAKELCNYVNEVWLMVANKPNKHAVDLAPANHRLAMAKKAFASARIQVRDDEIRRGGVSYTYDTYMDLMERFPQDHFVWVIGSDLLEEFQRWKNAETLSQKPFWIVFRPYVEIDRQKLAAFSQVKVLRFGGFEISSTQLRAWLKKGEYQKAEPFLPPSVLAYIREKKLYV